MLLSSNTEDTDTLISTKITTDLEALMRFNVLKSRAANAV